MQRFVMSGWKAQPDLRESFLGKKENDPGRDAQSTLAVALDCAADQMNAFFP